VNGSSLEIGKYAHVIHGMRSAFWMNLIVGVTELQKISIIGSTLDLKLIWFSNINLLWVNIDGILKNRSLCHYERGEAISTAVTA
jgi:hypothetical protein